MCVCLRCKDSPLSPAVEGGRGAVLSSYFPTLICAAHRLRSGARLSVHDGEASTGLRKTTTFLLVPLFSGMLLLYISPSFTPPQKQNCSHPLPTVPNPPPPVPLAVSFSPPHFHRSSCFCGSGSSPHVCSSSRAETRTPLESLLNAVSLLRVGKGALKGPGSEPWSYSGFPSLQSVCVRPYRGLLFIAYHSFCFIHTSITLIA